MVKTKEYYFKAEILDKVKAKNPREALNKARKILEKFENFEFAVLLDRKETMPKPDLSYIG